MTQDEIIALAREAGVVMMDENANEYVLVEDLPNIVAMERNICLQICDDLAKYGAPAAEACAAAIRARSENGTT